MTPRHEEARPRPPRFLVLFTIFGIPLLTALPFLLSGFIGRG